MENLTEKFNKCKEKLIQLVEAHLFECFGVSLNFCQNIKCVKMLEFAELVTVKVELVLLIAMLFPIILHGLSTSILFYNLSYLVISYIAII